MIRSLPAFLRAAALALALPASAIATPAMPLPGQSNGAEDTVRGEGGWRPGNLVAPAGKSDRIYGPADADLTLIVWIDPECPYCKVFGNTGERLVDSAEGRLNLVVRLLPLPFHGEPAMAASAMALCVADQSGAEGFYRFLDAYLAMTATNGRGIPARAGGGADPLLSLAVASGASDTALLRTCRRSGETLRRVMAEGAAGEAAGVGGTPSIAIRNNRSGDSLMADGAIPEEDIKAAVNWLAARTPKAAPAGA